jgi:hypothetical protein
VANEEITRAFMEKGWEIRYRGGNSKCTTPTDLDVIVADMPGSPGGKSSTPWLGPPTRYSIAARVSGTGVYGGQGPIFNLYDAERGVTVGCGGCRARSGRRSFSGGTAYRSLRYRTKLGQE